MDGFSLRTTYYQDIVNIDTYYHVVLVYVIITDISGRDVVTQVTYDTQIYYIRVVLFTLTVRVITISFETADYLIHIFIYSDVNRVVVKGSKSDWAPVTCGIPQGSVLGPLLFVIFINDLPAITQCTTQMFADDTKIFSPVATTEDREKLQNDLDNLCVWSDKWQLRFNASKCKVLHTGNTNPHYKYNIQSIDGPVQLEETELEKDLGVHIDPELKFSKHVERQVNKANRIL